MSASKRSRLIEAEYHAFNREQEAMRLERFRRVVLANPDLTMLALSERFGMTVKQVSERIRKLGLPRPPETDLDGLGHYLRGNRKRRKEPTP
jgi:hypothetical protein